MLYWRSANIIISKMLTLADVARYEISYKLFAIAQIVPMMLSTTVFPKLAALYGNEGKTSLKPLYNQLFYLYFLFGLMAFTFIFSFGYLLLPLLFGETYSDVPRFTTEMFLTMLVFPTALLQANVLVAMKLERFDMLFNIASLIVNVALSIIGIRYFQSLSVINYSIFISFFIFHVLQDIILIKRGVSSLKHVLKFYVVATAATLIYIYVSPFLSNYIWFVLFWLIAGALVLFATPAGRKGLELVRARSGTKKLAMERNLEGR
jgi:O-antigen/teichoic acid export membrane protein